MTVYIVQNPQHFDYTSGKLKDRFDFSSAEEYGELQFLLSPNAQPFNADEIANELHEKLQNFKSSDYLLLVGNPCLIGMSVAIAADYSLGKMTLLQWSGTKRKYIPVRIDLFTEPPA